MIKDKSNEKYVDLVSPKHAWKYGSKYTEDCFGSMSDVISAFNILVPNIRPLNPLNIEQEF